MKKISMLLILVMLFASLTACMSTVEETPGQDTPADNPLKQPEDTQEEAPDNPLYAAFLNTKKLTSLEGSLTVISNADGAESTSEFGVAVGYTADKAFAAQIQYAPAATEKGVYYEGNQKYCYGSGVDGATNYYSERADMESYDIGSSLLSHMMLPTVMVDRMLYFNWSNEFVISDMEYTCDALMAMSPEITEDAEAKTVLIKATYDSIVKALLPDTARHANVSDAYKDYNCTLRVEISEKGYISLFAFGYEAAEGAESNHSQSRTLRVDKVNAALEMQKPRQVTGAKATYTNYRCIDGDICYLLSPNKGISAYNKHPDNYESFKASVIPAQYAFLGEDRVTVKLAVLKEAPCGRKLSSVDVDGSILSFEKLVVEKGLKGRTWDAGAKQTEIYVMWEQSENTVAGSYEKVYYMGQWEYVDGVPTAK